jgi:hypothetical protein
VTGVWTGDEAIFWGGRRIVSPNPHAEIFGSGGRYDPATDTWAPTFTDASPGARKEHTALWTGA